MNDNRLIEASAGTGKTQALAQRIIALMRGGVKPQEIVALTFSRAAAGEIFERFVTLLAENAEKDPADVALLRQAIATQHLSQIGTLDSFLMRIVRSFPLELGLIGELELMDEYRSKTERARISFDILRRCDAAIKRSFVEAFSMAMDHQDVRGFTESYREFINSWHETVMAHQQAQSWGDAAEIFGGKIPAFMNANAESLGRAADQLAMLKTESAWVDLVDWIRNFRGSFKGSERGLVKKLLELDGLLTLDAIEVKYCRKNYSFIGSQAKVVQSAFLEVFGFALKQKLEMAKGIYTLVSAFEHEYNRRIRKQGRLVFADVPRLVAALPDTERLAIEYRMDAKIRAWALDEFQDTSREQWQAIESLIHEARDSAGEKSVFVVGDRKQAIYGWRNGDVRIFRQERDSGGYQVESLDLTWRSGPAIVDAINRIFVHGRLKAEFPEWESNEHQSAHPKLTGSVQTIESPGEGMSDFIGPIVDALKAVRPWERGIDAAVLVRKRDFGRLIVDALRENGIDAVVWEGENNALDTPALLAFLDLTILADHPNNQQIYRHFLTTPLCLAKYGGRKPSADEISSEFALAFTTKGLVRTFRELRALLPVDPKEAWSTAIEERYIDMLRAASEFELVREAGTRLADFTNFLQSRTKRSTADAGKVRVMTMHHAKGLGFDYVILPLYEPQGISGALKDDEPIIGNNWVLPRLKKPVLRELPRVCDAWNEMEARFEQEALCVYYVAMTRAKRAITIVLHPQAKDSKSSTVRFSEFVREALPPISTPIGKSGWYLEKEKGQRQGERLPDDLAQRSSVAKFVRGKRVIIKRRLPSLSFAAGQSAGSLFARNNTRQAAMNRGRDIHAELAKVDFIKGWLEKPEDFSGLWRERSFELFVEGEWISGCFDRVVFSGEGEKRQAAIYDFKTNRNYQKLSEAEFLKELTEKYAGQLAAYRKALNVLTGIPLERISAAIIPTEFRKSS